MMQCHKFTPYLIAKAIKYLMGTPGDRSSIIYQLSRINKLSVIGTFLVISKLAYLKFLC